MRERKSLRQNSPGQVHVVLWILVGIVLILSDIALELWAHKIGIGEEGKGVVGSMSEEVVHLFSRSFEAIGIAALVFGMFSLFIELPGLRNYFLDRMRELVVEKEYLKNLSEEELKRIQFSVVKANFHDDDIGEKGSFVEFLYSDIYKHIGSPYRERVTLEIRYEKQGEHFFVAHDRMSYICRMSRGHIIEAILWQNDPEEIEEIKDLKVRVKYPKNLGFGEDSEKTIAELRGRDLFIMGKDGELEKKEDLDKILGRELRISRDVSYRDVDQMKVIIDAVYVVRASHFHYWLMTYPTKDFSLILKFPDEYQCQAATFINNEHVGELKQERGYYSFFYNSWMIPQSGVAWRLIPAGECVHVQKT